MCEAGPHLHQPGPPGCGPSREARKTMGDQGAPKGPPRTVAAARQLGTASRGRRVGPPHPPVGCPGGYSFLGWAEDGPGSSPRPQHLRLSHLCPD